MHRRTTVIVILTPTHHGAGEILRVAEVLEEVDTGSESPGELVFLQSSSTDKGAEDDKSEVKRKLLTLRDDAAKSRNDAENLAKKCRHKEQVRRRYVCTKLW
jgi:hypothetical protein